MREEQQRLAKEVELKQRVVEKAVRIREKRQGRLQQSADHQRRLEASRVRYQENLAHTLAWKEKADAKQQKRYEALVKDLTAESKVWITEDNLTSLITADLFAAPATTGLTTKTSDFWRYHTQSLKTRRLQMMANEDNDYYASNALKDSLNMGEMELATKKYQAGYKLQTHEFLNSMVATGEDRSQFRSYVDKFSKLMEDADLDKDDLVNYVSELFPTSYLEYEDKIVCTYCV